MRASAPRAGAEAEASSIATRPETDLNRVQRANEGTAGAARASSLLLPAAVLLAILLPTELSFSVGSLRLTAYRALLLIAVLPCAARVLAGDRRAPDVLMTLLGLWIPAILTYHHGLETGLETGGIQSIELVGAYFVARRSVQDVHTYSRVARLLVWSVLGLLPFVVYESVTGHHVLKSFAASIAGGGQSFAVIDQRYGFTRAWGPFDHPILLGVYAASVVPLAWLAPWRARRPVYSSVLMVFGTALCALGSLSSGAITAFIAQGIVMVWNRLARSVRAKWWILSGLALLAYIAIDFISNRSGLLVLLSYLTFDKNTAYGRTIIWEYGFWENAMRSPFVGIGLNDWVRPVWITDPSVDNHWLLIMMVYGLPGFAMLAGAVFLALRRGVAAARSGGGDMTRRAAKAWAFSLFGLAVAAATVAFWNSSLVYFSFVLGCWGAFISRSGSVLVQPINRKS